MSINAGNVFSALSLSRHMCASLPVQSSPQLKNPFDAVALLAHACMLAVGFRLIGLGEDHRLDEISDGNSETEDVKPLPEDWNSTTSSHYAFRYAHSQSSLQYLIKISRLGGKAIINGLGVGDDKVQAVDFHIKDFLSESSFPFTLPASDDQDQSVRSLQDVFISPGRILDLASLLKLQIIQKLAPGLRKEGYEESAQGTSQTSAERRQQLGEEPHGPSQIRDPIRDDRLPPFAQPRAISDPLAAPPTRPFPAGDFPPPGFEDEYEINRPLARGGLGGERRPLNIGERDLYPQGLGPHDPLRGGGFGPSGGFGGGGMHPTFDDPIFGGDGGGLGGYDGRAPPGARYDPVGPNDGPPNLRGGPPFPGRGGPRGGGVGGGFGSGHPSNPFDGYGRNDFM